ncbi:MAG: ABC transporter substrate-binding protein, partial [Eubacteriales bacterium]|nr:ABC transporter substrate-binding protein [Eubacteriales bacterium]
MTFKKFLAMALVAVMALSMTSALASSAPDWTEFDALIDEIKTTTDFANRVTLMHQAEDILMETGALMPIYYYNDIFMAKPGVEGYYSNPFGTKFFQHATKGEETTFKLQLASEPDKLDPALNSTVDGATLAANSFGGLYTYNAEGKLTPNFATGFEMSEDGLTYTFTMREGLQWSNGDPLTAKDFEYSWKRAVAGETAADYSYMFNSIAGYPDNLEVMASEDGTVFTVKLSSPTAYFLDLAAFPTFFAVHQETVENAAGYKNEAGEVVSPGAWALEAGFVSSGAFMLESWTHEESMVYVKNPNYWDAENVKLEKLEFMLSADDVAIFAAYQAGDLDFIDTVPPDQIKGLIGTEEFHVVDELGTYYGIFNVKSPLFEGMTVEQAAAFRKGV